MRASKWMAGAGAALAMTLAASPAQAQYYPYHPDPRDRDVVQRVVGAVGAVAGAVANVTRGYDPYGRYGYGQSFEQQAVNSCAYEADRRYQRYGRPNLRVQNVYGSRHDRVLVTGAVELPDARYYDRWNSRPAYRLLGFTCEVRIDGRVIDFDDHDYDGRHDPYRRW